MTAEEPEWNVTDYTSGQAWALHRFRLAFPEERLFAFQPARHVAHAQQQAPFRCGMPALDLGRRYLALTPYRLVYGTLILRADDILRGELIRYGSTSGPRIRLWVEMRQGGFHYFDTTATDAWTEREHFQLPLVQAAGPIRVSPETWVRRALWLALGAMLVLSLLQLWRRPAAEPSASPPTPSERGL